MLPTISVVIPNYNNGAFLAEAINSALSQSCRDQEVWVVDDGSTDDSRRILDGFGQRIHVVYQSNLGPAAARNAGVRAAKGKYIHFLDADDVLMPRALECLAGIMHQHPEAGMVSGGAIVRNMISGEESRQLPGKGEGNIFVQMIAGNHLITSATLARRATLLEAGLFDEDRTLQVVEDYDLWLRMARIAPIYFIREPLVHRRMHAANISNEPGIFLHKEIRLFRKWLIREKDRKVRRLIRRKLGRLYHELAYLARNMHDGTSFRAFSKKACRVNPGWWKNWAYLIWSHSRLSLRCR